MHDVRNKSNQAYASLLAVALACGGFASTVHGQTRLLEHADISKLTERGPRPRPEIEAFVKDLSSNDARIEVVVGQGRLLTLRNDLVEPGQPAPLIAIGDPTVLDFQIIDTRHLRLTGQRIGVTDLSIIAADQEVYSFEVAVVVDLTLLEAQLRMSFPEAQLRLAQHREHVIVDGQARDTRQVSQILAMIRAFLDSAQTATSVKGKSGLDPTVPGEGDVPPPDSPESSPEGGEGEEPAPPAGLVGAAERPDITATLHRSQIINLIRVPGPQQVMLKVQVAELNRTALRRIGTSMVWQDGHNAIGSAIGPALPQAQQMTVMSTTGDMMAQSSIGTAVTTLLGLLNPLDAGASTSTLFGVFDTAKTSVLLDALRQNQVLTILAEPTLVALHGQEASFLAGGSFPIPVPQPSGGQNLVTIEFREFGVSLLFVPFILDDETVRLVVNPKVSSIDFSTGVVFSGTAVPGEATREAKTTVEMIQGQTLAIAGILQVEMDGSTNRIPGLGDLPLLGTMFRNTSTQKTEKELIVLVTPHLIESIRPEQMLPLPVDQVREPNDRELYFKGRIESREWEHYRSTEAWDDPIGVERIRRTDEPPGRVLLHP